ncbi:MAG TPA: galactose oxidase-like domain-containing protein [Pedococcus sp.]|nr:galactose oxidase-like domain-containing protein [Pedococcus sp.]
MKRTSWTLAGIAAAALAGANVLPAVAASAPAGAAVAATIGSWSSPFVPPGANTRVIGVHSVMLYTGKVLVFGALRPTQGYVYDPVTGAATETDPPADVECGSMTALRDGRILVVGGHAKGAKGINNILLFDPVKLTWTAQPASPMGRYYPTSTLLADGTVLISGGFDMNGNPNPDVEVWTPPPTGGSVGTLRKVGGPHPSGLYPHQWVLPGGKVLEVTSRSTSILDPSTWTWTSYPKPKMKHGSGEGAVLLPGPASGSTKVMYIGGKVGGAATDAVETFDAANPSAGWSALASLPQPRTHMSPVLMPDGSVLGVGGNSSGNFAGPIYTTLSYKPSSNSWTTLAAQAERRAYHSSAVLLPDGRVFSAGDTGSGGGGNTDEIFSPPYLSLGARPTITSSPAQAANGASFTIATPDTTSRAVLIHPGSSTHTIGFDERILTLSTTATATGLTAVAPSATVGVAGWYMLFLVNSSGVPSTAKWIHIG